MKLRARPRSLSITLALCLFGCGGGSTDGGQGNAGAAGTAAKGGSGGAPQTDGGGGAAVAGMGGIGAVGGVGGVGAGGIGGVGGMGGIPSGSEICLAVVQNPDPTDPTDSDKDGLSDYDECLRYESDPSLEDSDGDRLADGIEVLQYGSSPALADTDADGLEDADEVARTRSPVVADVPVIKVTISTNPVVGLNEALDMSTGERLDAVSSTLTAQTNSSTQSDTRSTTDTIKNSMSVSTSLEANYPWSASASVEATASVEEAHTETQTSSWGESSIQESQNQQETAVSNELQSSLSYDSGTIRVGFDLENAGRRDVIIKNLRFAALMHELEVGRPTLVTELTPSVGDIQINAGSQWQFLQANDDAVPPFLVKRVMQKPRAFFFEVSGFDMEVLDGPEGQPFTSAGLASRTATIVIDFGGGRVERHLVATGLDRQLGGIRMVDAMSALPINGDYGTEPDASGTRLLTRIRTWTADPVRPTSMWLVTSSSLSLNSGPVSFDDILLRAGDVTRLVYLEDDDEDRLPNRVESIIGTEIDQPDTDLDGISDYDEAYGWVGVGAERFFTDPLDADQDDDFITDGDERLGGTNPFEPCDPGREPACDAADACEAACVSTCADGCNTTASACNQNCDVSFTNCYAGASATYNTCVGSTFIPEAFCNQIFQEEVSRCYGPRAVCSSLCEAARSGCVAAACGAGVQTCIDACPKPVHPTICDLCPATP